MLEVKNGNLDALVPLYDNYSKKMYNFFLRVTHDRVASEDLAQNVFSRILSYRNSYNEVYSFKSWIWQIARNVHIDHYSKNKILISDYPSEKNFEKEKSDALDQLEKEDRVETIREALGLLTPEQREIIELSRFQDLKYEEISQLTGNSVGAVRVKVHRAIKKLKEVYFQIA